MKKIISIVLSVVMLLSAVSYLPTAVGATYNVPAIEKNDTFEFGMYPKSLVTDYKLCQKLENRINYWAYSEGDDGVSITDVEYNDVRYRGVNLSGVSMNESEDYSESVFSHVLNKNGIDTSMIYWFEYEPIEWVVLDAEEGIVATTNVIDVSYFLNSNYIYMSDGECYSSYYEENAYANNYASSTICSRVNNIWCDAFDKNEMNFVGKYYIYKDYNDVNTENIYGPSEEYTPVYLLSYSDIVDVNSDGSNLKIAKPTDYSEFLGIDASVYRSDKSYGVNYLLGSIGDTSYSIYYVDQYGDIYSTNSYEELSTYGAGIRLSMKLDLNDPELICLMYGHDTENSDEISKLEPTCIYEGYVEYYCNTCGQYYKEETEPIGIKTNSKTISGSTLESEHPYSDYEDTTYEIYSDSATSVILSFDGQTEVENGYDFIDILDEKDNLILHTTGNALANRTVKVKGSKAKIRLTSDSSTNSFGFMVTSTFMIDEKYEHDYTFKRVVMPSICTMGGVSEYKCEICGSEDLIATDPIGELYENIVEYGEPIESDHPYEDYAYEPYYIKKEGVDRIELDFGEFSFESGYDYLNIQIEGEETVNQYTGDELDGKTLSFDADSLILTLESDSSNNYYGFEITEVRYITNAKYSHPKDKISSEILKDGGCEESSTIKYTCLQCNQTWTEEVDSVGHDNVEISKIPATCTEDGKVTYKCNKCGKVTEEIIQSIGHTYIQTGYKLTEKGTEITQKCTACDDSVNTIIPMVINNITVFEGIDGTYRYDMTDYSNYDAYDILSLLNESIKFSNGLEIYSTGCDLTNNIMYFNIRRNGNTCNLSGEKDSINYNHDYGYKLTINDGQTSEDFWEKGDHVVTAVLESYMDSEIKSMASVTFEFIVTLKDNPFKSVKGYKEIYYDSNDGYWTNDNGNYYWEYYYNFFSPDYTIIVLKDTEKEIRIEKDQCIEIDGRKIKIYAYYEGGYDNRLIADSDYQLDIFPSYSTGYLDPYGICYLKVLEIPQVVSLELNDIEVYENTNCGYETDEAGNKRQVYYFNINDVNGTVTFSDGTVSDVTNGRYTDISGNYYCLDYTDPSEGNWSTTGKNKITVYFGEIETTINVTLIESLVKNIHIGNLTFPKADYYYVDDLSGYVEMKDGTIIPIQNWITNKETESSEENWQFGLYGGMGGYEGNPGFEYEGEKYSIDFSIIGEDGEDVISYDLTNLLSYYTDNEGIYEINAICSELGYNAPALTATITKSNIKNVIINDTITEVNFNDQTEQDTFCCLGYDDYTFVLDDGTHLSSGEYQTMFNVGLFPGETYLQSVKVGDIVTCTHTINGEKYSHKVTIVDSTIKSIEIIKIENEPKNQYDYLNNVFYGSTFKVTYQNGKEETVVVGEHNVYFYNDTFSFNNYALPYSINKIEAGSSFVIKKCNDFTFNGAEVVFQSGLIAKVDSAEIIYFTKDDNTSYLSLKLHTDLGTFEIRIFNSDSCINMYLTSKYSYDYEINGSFEDSSLNSETLSNYMEMIHKMFDYASDSIEKSKSYNGSYSYSVSFITAEYVNESTFKVVATTYDGDIVTIYYYMNDNSYKVETVTACEHTSNEKWIDADSYHYIECSLCGKILDSAVHTYDNSCDTTCNDCGHVRTITHQYVGTITKPATTTSTGIKTYVCSVCGDKYTETIPVEVAAVKGDLNGDTKINAIDANLMSKYILGQLPPTDKLTAAADINSDGKVNAIDANRIKALIVG